eukprot:313878-Amphidinium_carterae.1
MLVPLACAIRVVPNATNDSKYACEYLRLSKMLCLSYQLRVHLLQATGVCSWRAADVKYRKNEACTRCATSHHVNHMSHVHDLLPQALAQVECRTHCADRFSSGFSSPRQSCRTFGGLFLLHSSSTEAIKHR